MKHRRRKHNVGCFQDRGHARSASTGRDLKKKSPPNETEMFWADSLAFIQANERPPPPSQLCPLCLVALDFFYGEAVYFRRRSSLCQTVYANAPLLCVDLCTFLLLQEYPNVICGQRTRHSFLAQPFTEGLGRTGLDEKFEDISGRDVPSRPIITGKLTFIP